jgi:hypothetical protein
LSAFDSVALRKSSLTTLSLNCGSQQPEKIIGIKDSRLTTEPVSKSNFGFPFPGHIVRDGREGMFVQGWRCRILILSSVTVTRGIASDKRRQRRVVRQSFRAVHRSGALPFCALRL